MQYYSPYARSIEYKNSSKIETSQGVISGGTTNHFRYGPEYFSGTNAYIYFGDILVDEIFSLQFTLTEQVQPIYGYNSYTADAWAYGQRLIQGTFDIYYRDSGYIFILLEEVKKRYDAGKVSTSFFSAIESPEEMTLEALLAAAAQGDSKAFDKIASQFESMLWGNAVADPVFNDRNMYAHNNPYFYSTRNFNSLQKAGFDVIITYGSEAKKQIQEKTKLDSRFQPVTAIETINGVRLQAVDKIIDATGTPIFERYTFLAEDLNRSIRATSGSTQSSQNTDNTYKEALKPQTTPYTKVSKGTTGAWAELAEATLNEILCNEIYACSKDKNYTSEMLTALGSSPYKVLPIDGSFGDKDVTYTKAMSKYFATIYGSGSLYGGNGYFDDTTWSVCKQRNIDSLAKDATMPITGIGDIQYIPPMARGSKGYYATKLQNAINAWVDMVLTNNAIGSISMQKFLSELDKAGLGNTFTTSCKVKVDGDFGTGTATALKKVYIWLKTFGALSYASLVDKEKVWGDSLEKSAAKYLGQYLTNVSLNMSNSATVTTVQAALNEWADAHNREGGKYALVPITGKYDDKTKALLTSFKTSLNITDPTPCGESTYEKLKAYIYDYEHNMDTIKDNPFRIPPMANGSKGKFVVSLQNIINSYFTAIGGKIDYINTEALENGYKALPASRSITVDGTYSATVADIIETLSWYYVNSEHEVHKIAASDMGNGGNNKDICRALIEKLYYEINL